MAPTKPLANAYIEFFGSWKLCTLDAIKVCRILLQKTETLFYLTTTITRHSHSFARRQAPPVQFAYSRDPRV